VKWITLSPKNVVTRADLVVRIAGPPLAAVRRSEKSRSFVISTVERKIAAFQSALDDPYLESEDIDAALAFAVHEPVAQGNALVVIEHNLEKAATAAAKSSPGARRKIS
jgi:hypothetical protein